MTIYINKDSHFFSWSPFYELYNQVCLLWITVNMGDMLESSPIAYKQGQNMLKLFTNSV